MPDSTFSKYLCETYPWMRMSYFQENNNNPQTIVWWGEGDKNNIVYSHRDRILDRILLDMIEAGWLISVKADKEFQLFIKHFETLRRAKVTNNKGIERYVWDSTTGEDHYVFSTLYYRLAVMAGGAGGFFCGVNEEKKFILFQEHYETFCLMLNHGVFDVRNGSITFHMDKHGAIKTINRADVLYSARHE